MGNLGFFETECYSQFKGFEKIKQTLQCSQKDAKLNLLYFGLIADNTKQENVFQVLKDTDNKVGNSFCGNPEKLNDHDNCKDYLDEISFQIDWNETC